MYQIVNATPTPVPLEKWFRDFCVPEQMTWRGAVGPQIDGFQRLCDAFPQAQAFVVNTHTSKSIKLPVVELRFPNGKILLRDNFYSLEIAVLWDFAPALSYGDVYGDPKDWGWYCEEEARAEAYSWRGWTTEEIEDPRITRVFVKNPFGGGYWNEKRPDEKERWVKRGCSPEWYGKDWSSPLLYEGEFRPGVKLYHAQRTHLEGIADVIPRDACETYQIGKKSFTVSTSWGAIQGIIGRIASTPNP